MFREESLMNNFEIIVYWSMEDNAFIAEVPELAGCMADGESYVEAVKNAETAITEWIETAQLMGRSVPAARGKLVYA
jgi:predicted RNase H-like HicB family nuclease